MYEDQPQLWLCFFFKYIGFREKNPHFFRPDQAQIRDSFQAQNCSPASSLLPKKTPRIASPKQTICSKLQGFLFQLSATADSADNEKAQSQEKSEGTGGCSSNSTVALWRRNLTLGGCSDGKNHIDFSGCLLLFGRLPSLVIALSC